MGNAGPAVVEEGGLASARFFTGFLVVALALAFAVSPPLGLRPSSGAGAK